MTDIMTDKEQKLVELGYELDDLVTVATKKIEYNARSYTIAVWYSINKMVIHNNNYGFIAQQDIDDLQIVFNRTQDELRKAGILE